LSVIFFAESALTERRTTTDCANRNPEHYRDHLNEDLFTADEDIQSLKAREAKLAQELTGKEDVVRGLRLSVRILEEESLKYEKLLKNKDSTVSFRVSSLLRSKEMNLFLSLLIFVF